MTYPSSCTRSGSRAFLFVCACFVSQHLAATTAHAYDLSRQEPGRDDWRIERGFVDLQAGLWIPGWESFGDNHDVSAQLGGEVGFRIFSASDQHLFLVGGLTVSPQTLPRWLVQRDDNVYLAFIGIRWMPGTICSMRGVGCLFVELGLGVAWESVEPEPGHDPPDGEIAFTAGLGYRFRLGRVLNVGARIDFTYLEEDYESSIGWLTPTAFIGASF